MSSNVREFAEGDFQNDLLSIEQKISKHRHDVVRLFETCLAAHSLSESQVKDMVDEYLRELRVELARLIPSETLASETYLTRDPMYLTNEDLVCLDSAIDGRELSDLYEQWPYQRQHHAIEGAFTGLHTPSNSSVPIATGSSRSDHNGNHDGVDNNETISLSLRQDSMESPPNLLMSPQSHSTSYGHPLSAHTIQRPSQNTNKRQTNRGNRVVRWAPLLPSTFGPDSLSLNRRLASTYPKHAHVLTYMFAAAGNLDTLSHFLDALKHLKSHQDFRLPRVSSGFAALFQSLEHLEGAQFALCLQRRIGLIRMLICRNQIFHSIERERQNQLYTSPEVGRRNMISSETLDRLVQASRSSSVEEDDEKLRTKIKNHLSASRSWWDLSNALGLGALAIFPQMASSSYATIQPLFERVPSEGINILAQHFLANKAEEFFAVTEVLSHHLNAILEGTQCNLMEEIISKSVQTWQDICRIDQNMDACAHGTSNDQRS